MEFKQEIPVAEPTKGKAMKTVCAFANGDGGSLLFGITDDYEVVGLPKAKISRFKDALSDLVDAWVEPTPSYTFEVLCRRSRRRRLLANRQSRAVAVRLIQAQRAEASVCAASFAQCSGASTRNRGDRACA